MWHRVSVVGLLLGIIIVLLGFLRIDPGERFRQICTGLLVFSLGCAGLYAERKAGEDGEH